MKGSQSLDPSAKAILLKNEMLSAAEVSFLDFHPFEFNSVVRSHLKSQI